MNVEYQAALIFVKNVAASRDFYVKVLQQKIEYDFGEDVLFHGGFAIHDANHISGLLFGRKNPNNRSRLGKENFELYFECDDMEGISKKLADSGVTFIHELKQQPWGQRVCRFYDPDNHIVEIGEAMPVVIARYLDEGLSSAEVAERTSMPVEEVERIAEERSPE